MGRFYPLYIRRSDGKAETVSKGQRKSEVNQPTEEQLDQRPDRNGISDFYRQVAPDEPKHLDWRRKIGGMLARELNSHQKGGTGGGLDNGYILATFPENYRLYEHVKRRVVDGKMEIKSKTHGAAGGGGGGGGNDRQDAYLYGHPLGRRKRFRSPGDFFPHVLWLATDESGDADNCTCKLCSPEDLENLIPGGGGGGGVGGSVQVKKQQQPVTSASSSSSLLSPSSSTATTRPTSSQGSKVKAEVIPSTSPSTTTSTTTSASASKPTSSSTTSPPTPTPLPPKKSHDQFYDSQYRSFIYRPGELIWFQRGQAWGLGIIVRRWGHPHNPSDRNYLVQPLSHPPLPPSHPNYPSTIIKSSELEMRPWIAWSVPRFTNDGLNNISPPPQYESIDWQAVKDHRFGTGDLEVDASILAAKMIDSSYTPFSKSRIERPSQGISEMHYEGIFLGAEKFWIGDPIRLHFGSSGTDIMVLQSIIERSSNNPSSNTTSSELQFLGDVYTLSQTPHSNPQHPTPASPNSNPHLPIRLTEDLAYRNARSIPRKGYASWWKLSSSQARVGINDVKGRWYEASLILPILQPAAFAEAEMKGEIQEAGLWMNSRGDCVVVNGQQQQRGGRVNVRRERREDGFGSAVPRGLSVLEGLIPPTQDDAAVKEEVERDMLIDPIFETVEDNDNRHDDVGGDDDDVEQEGNDDPGKGSFEELMEFR